MILMAILYGLLGAVAGWLFILIFRICDRFFASLPAPIYVRTSWFSIGHFGSTFPLTRYFGHHELNAVISNNFSLFSNKPSCCQDVGD